MTSSHADILDRHSFGEFFVHYYNELYAYANAVIRDEAVAEDIVQDVFAKYWENRSSIRLEKSAIGYFYVAVRNKCYNYLEHLQVERNGISVLSRRVEDETSRSDPDETNNPRIEQVRRVLDKLPLKCKRVVVLSCIEGMKYHEIAAEMNISVNTVRTHVSRAYSFIRKNMPVGLFFKALIV